MAHSAVSPQKLRASLARRGALLNAGLHRMQDLVANFQLAAEALHQAAPEQPIASTASLEQHLFEAQQQAERLMQPTPACTCRGPE